ncbi:MAG: ABC transporter ATP-binding protein [Anaerolineales bacterium]|nr:ABC transporter ATP-binding protein [Anaerolineales bacterium]
MESGKPLLEVRNLNSVFPSNGKIVRAVSDVSFALAEGQILGVVGESGCGKSTLLLSLLRLIRYPGRVESGEMLFREKNIIELSDREMRDLRGKEISMIFQDPLSTLNPAFTVGEQIRESLRLHNIVSSNKLPWPFDGLRRAQEKERVLQIMNEVGIPSPMDRYASYPHQFSGGMQQRTLIAIALACSPALLLADEPTTALDVTIQAQILNLMKRINEDRGTAIILVTHDLGLASEFCDRIAVMYAGRFVEQGTVDEIVENPQHPYTQGLLNCRPRIGERDQTIRPIPGNVPSLANLPNGCAFAPRCSYVKEVCETGPVPMFETDPGHLNRCLITSEYRRQPDWDWGVVVGRERA